MKPGQEVEAGQILLKIDSTRFASSLGENNAEYLSLLAKSARLKALATGEPFVAPEEVLKQAPNLIEMERNAWQARTSELNATVNVAREQLKQRQEELRETIAKRDQASASCGLTSRELQVTRPLLKSGAVSGWTCCACSATWLATAANRKRRGPDRPYPGLHQGSPEQARGIGAEYPQPGPQRAVGDQQAVHAARGQAGAGRPGQAGRGARAVRGTVKTLFNNTVGGVVQPGKDIIEIVPKDDTLLLEVRILPRDIGFHADQKAEVKFTAYDFAIYGGLEGKVEQIGADTVTDEKGNSYYVVRVRTDRSTVGTRTCPSSPGWWPRFTS